ncbi:MAG TPA: hypothetical protein PLY88_07500 [Candidatus Omnitrophota bacterium]|nr:hypothetical protein [Candidatus Omnitrophota bacterium]
MSWFAGLAALLLSFLLLQRLPLTFGDDLNIIAIAKSAGWKQLFSELINPLTPAWYVHGAECQLTTRVFQTLVFKILYSFFGYSFDAFNFHKALAFSVCVGLVFRITALYFKTLLGGGIAAIFFLVSAPLFFTTSWIADTEVLSQAFLLGSVYFFLKIRNKNEFCPAPRLLLFAILYFVCGWMAIKLKETARLLPFVVFAYLVTVCGYSFLRRVSVRKESFWIAVIPTSILLFAVIPFFPDQNLALDSKSDTALRSLHIDGFLIFFRFLISEIFYPFLGMALAFVMLKFCPDSDKKEGSKFELSSNFIFVAFWIGASCAGLFLNFELTTATTRYFSTALLPCYILCGAIIGLAFKFYQKACFLHKPISIAMCLLCLFSLGSLNGGSFFSFKLDEILFFRNFNLAINVADYRLTYKLYCDFYGHCPSMQELDDFYRNNKSMFSEIRLKEWDKNTAFTKGALERHAAKWGKSYVFSFRGDLDVSHRYLKLTDSGDTHSGSFYNDLFSKIKKKSIRSIYLYRFIPDVSV